jgi:phenylacetate-coenzyme A ligase PaaK-like adenylate-forming protein
MKLSPLDPWISKKIATNQSLLTRQEIEAWQMLKLNETLALARSKSSFYQKLFTSCPDSINSLDELHQFPFTTPDDIRHNPLQFVCVSQDAIQRVVTLQTTGTTGEPKRIYFTADDQELTIDFFGIGMSTLTEPGDRVLILLPCTPTGSVGDLLRIGLQRLGMNPSPYGPVRDPYHALETMQYQRVDCVVGSPTQVLGLARRWKPGMHRPRSVLLSTDYVPQAIVEVLNETWGCEVYNHYGATEMGLGGGVECAAHRGYHLREADLDFEVVDPITGDAVQDGEHGEVVFSTLTRHGMPLIRYRMGDRSRFIPGDCPCGTRLKTLEKVRGRFSGFVLVGDGMLSLPDFDEALFSIPGLLNYSLSLTGDREKPSIQIDTQMLTDAKVTKLIELALQSIEPINDLEVIIHNHHNPGEAGSLLKRIILDRRDGGAMTQRAHLV